MNTDSNSGNVKNITIINQNNKSTFIAYILLIFFGTLGLHRFYIGQVGLGVTLLLLTIFGWITLPFGGILLLIVIIWLIVDLFILHTSVRKINEQIEQSALLKAQVIIKNNN